MFRYCRLEAVIRTRVKDHLLSKSPPLKGQFQNVAPVLHQVRIINGARTWYGLNPKTLTAVPTIRILDNTQEPNSESRFLDLMQCIVTLTSPQNDGSARLGQVLHFAETGRRYGPI